MLICLCLCFVQAVPFSRFGFCAAPMSYSASDVKETSVLRCVGCNAPFETDDKKGALPRSFPCFRGHTVCTTCVVKQSKEQRPVCPAPGCKQAPFSDL